MVRFAWLVLGFVVCIANATPGDIPSALNAAPEGWLDPLKDAGPELKGWTRVPIPPDGKLGATSQWSLDPTSGHLICAGAGGHEWLRFDQPYRDVVYHVEWRFVPVTEGKNRYNSGIYARNSADGAIWHQAQTGGGSGGYLFGDTPVDGKVKRVNLSKSVMDQRVKPAGEWNTFEITCRGKEISLWVNGNFTNRWFDCEVPEGYLGVEAEGYRIEFRNLRIKPLDAK